MKTTSRLLASILGVIVASPVWAAGFGNGGSPFGGSSPFSSFSNPLGFGASPFGLSPLSMASPLSGGGFPMMGGSSFPMMGSGFPMMGGSGFPMMGSGFPMMGGSGFPMMGGSGFPMMGSGFSPLGSGMSPYSPFSPFSPLSPMGGGMMSRGLGSPFGGGLPFAGTSAFPLGGMASPYSMYGASPYGYGLPPLTGSPYLPYPAAPAPGMLPFAPLPY